MTFLHLLLQMSVAQNSPYAKVAYFGITHSGLLHYLFLYSNVKCNHNIFSTVQSKKCWNATDFTRIYWETEKEAQTQELSCAAGSIKVIPSKG